MYQDFFYLTSSICSIILTVFIIVKAAPRIYSRRSRLRHEGLYDSISELEQSYNELKYRIDKIEGIPTSNV
jgi:hypothetical protein